MHAPDTPALPAQFRWRQRSLTAVAASGPERIAPEWWLDEPDWRSGVRDYWLVTTGKRRAAVAVLRAWRDDVVGLVLPGGVCLIADARTRKNPPSRAGFISEYEPPGDPDWWGLCNRTTGLNSYSL